MSNNISFKNSSKDLFNRILIKKKNLAKKRNLFKERILLFLTNQITARKRRVLLLAIKR